MKRMSRLSSLYVTLGMSVLTTVVTVLIIQALYDYRVMKHRLIDDMRQQVSRSIQILQQNVSGLMDAYAVNEYEKLVRTALEQQGYLAVVIEDYNMGGILGMPSYVNGKIEVNGVVTDYDPSSPLHADVLDNAFYSETGTFQSGQKVLGKVTVYLSDEMINKEQKAIVNHTLTNTTAMLLLLTGTLFLTMRFLILKPLSIIVEHLHDTDMDGIPAQMLPMKGPAEIREVVRMINRMIMLIKRSRNAYEQQRSELKYERDRFQLAVDGTLDGMWDWNLQTNQVIHSDRYETMLGYEPGELTDTIACWEDLLHPDDVEDAYRVVNDYLATKGKGVYENTFRMMAKDGSWRWITGRGKALFDSSGNPVRFVGFNTDITEQVQDREALRLQKESMEYQAMHDALTGLANRALFNDRLGQSIELCKRNRSKLAVLFIDLDHFKEINDSFGHDKGDIVLQEVTKRLKRKIRREDTLARLGGDEFVIMMEGLKTSDDAALLGHKILDTFSVPIRLETSDFYVGCSIGISIYPEDGETAQEILRNADAAMYRAKSEGRNNFQYYSEELTEQAFERVNLETKLRNGLEKGEFIVHYQPQVNTRTGEIVGMEALVRWDNPEIGLVSPGKFLPLAESTGLIVKLDRYVMKEAMNQFASWYRSGLNPGTLAMNLSVKQLQRSDFVEVLKQLIEETGCSTSWLELEVTESQIMIHPDLMIEVLTHIRSMGIKLALDDFGTGYSSLAYLKRFPVGKLKIDRSFVMGLPDDEEDISISKMLIGLADNLGLEILAEGVETEAQQRLLMELGCETVQGYLTGKPMGSEALHSILDTQRNAMPGSA